MLKIVKTIGIVILLALITGCQYKESDRINGAGATFPAPLYYEWAHQLKGELGIEINYQSIGSGAGIKQAIARTVDFGASDKPLRSDELIEAKLLQFPAAIGSIVIAYNLPGIPNHALKLSNEAVAAIFSGKITRWNDPRITKDNPNLPLPAQKITVVTRSDGSGTTFNVTSWLAAISKEFATTVGSGIFG